MSDPTESQVAAGAKALRYGAYWSKDFEAIAKAVLTAALAVMPEPSADKTAAIAAELVREVRAGRLDPRKAATHLGLPFDQDIIMGILERAATAVEPVKTHDHGTPPNRRELQSMAALLATAVHKFRVSAVRIWSDNEIARLVIEAVEYNFGVEPE